jgi:tRNA(fMet)-specific endonuclease VapC
MKKYLLDTNICIYHIKGLYDLDKKIATAGIENCFLSEINIAELKYGIECSEQKEKNREKVEKFIKLFRIIPISSCLDLYAAEKAKLRKEGKLIDDFDLLIGCSAIANDLTLVTRNEKHFRRLTSIKIENWIDSPGEGPD